MKPSTNLFYLRSEFQRFFPSHTREALLCEAAPGHYPRKVEPWQLLFVILESYLRLASGLRSIVERHGEALGTVQISTLSYAIASKVFCRLARLALDSLSMPDSAYSKTDIVVLDSMAVSLPKTRRHNCAKMNNKTVGGGVLWGFCITAARTWCPVQIYSIMEGAWHDGTVMRKVKLLSRGPLYIMDQGFYIIDLAWDWMDKEVRFLVRVRAHEFNYTEVGRLGEPGRKLRAKVNLRGPKRQAVVIFDGIATLGTEKRRGKRPTVRLLVLELTNGTKTEKLILASSELRLDAQKMLDLYGRRWEVEEFHRVLKRSIGLAHLYSFRQSGIEALLVCAALLATLLWMSQQENDSKTHGNAKSKIPQLLRRLLKEARAILGLEAPWRPNTIGKNKWRSRK